MSSPSVQIASALRQVHKPLKEGESDRTFSFRDGLFEGTNVGVRCADERAFEVLFAGCGDATSWLAGHAFADVLPDFSCVPEGPAGRSAKIEVLGDTRGAARSCKLTCVSTLAVDGAGPLRTASANKALVLEERRFFASKYDMFSFTFKDCISFSFFQQGQVRE